MNTNYKVDLFFNVFGKFLFIYNLVLLQFIPFFALSQIDIWCILPFVLYILILLRKAYIDYNCTEIIDL